MTIFAAGAVLWREVNKQLMVAVIHRARYDDWSFAKGKLDPGETLPETAVREIAEETGLKIKLGIHLDVIRYTVANGTPKEVHYWASRVTDSALANSKFKPSEEVASVEWRTPDEARKVLSYDFDQKLLRQVEALFALGDLATKPVIILRHAKATPRADWRGGKNVEDGKRPLLPFGFTQAKSLIPLLTAFAPKRIITSPWERCKTTVAPYGAARKIKVIERSQLSEFGNAKGPKRTANVVEDVIEDGRSSIICTHRPALPTILETLGKFGTKEQAAKILEAHTLKPADMLVVHLSMAKRKAKRHIVSIETYSPFATEAVEALDTKTATLEAPKELASSL
jgi:8-oxo-dGTP diphosphatase